jgi:uncharacterized protein
VRVYRYCVARKRNNWALPVKFYPGIIGWMNKTMNDASTFLAFSGTQRLCRGSLEEVRQAVNKAIADKANAKLPTPWIFNEQTGELIDIDLTLPIKDSAIDNAPAAVGPGRPRLGVVAREVTLLPRHWDWLKAQPGGASVALRKLVEVAKKQSSSADDARIAQTALYKFMSAVAGNLANFEEASRALFAFDKDKFFQLIEKWPADVVEQLILMSTNVFIATEKKISSV